MQILITGIGRTGTTGLFSKIKNSMDENTTFLHEPNVVNKLNENMLVKLNIFKVKKNPVLLQIPKKILLIRDQRDRVISSLLFGLFQTWEGKEKKLHKILDTLRKKEQNPESISVLELHKIFHPTWDLEKQSKHYCNGLMDFSIEQKVLIYYYEDFVRQKFSRLEKYLGFKLAGSSDLGKRKYVLRTGASGDWKNWFCEEDVKFFRPLFSEYMKFFYFLKDEDNWDLDVKKSIPSSVASEYVLRIVNGLREKQGLGKVWAKVKYC